MAIVALVGVGIASLFAMIYSTGATTSNIAATANAQAASEPEGGNGISVQPVHVLTSDEFLAYGGRSAVSIVPEISKTGGMYTVDGTRGSTVNVVLDITHRAGANPVPVVDIVSKGIANGFIPPSAAKLTTEQDRVNALKTGGKIPGAIDLNSITTFSTSNISLKPGETKQVTMTINIPKDWPDETVGGNVLFSIVFGHDGKYDYHDVQVTNVGVLLHVTN